MFYKIYIVFLHYEDFLFVYIVTCKLMLQIFFQFIKIQDLKDLSFLAYIFILFLTFVLFFFSLFACIVGRWVGVVVEYQIVYQFNDSHI